MKKVLLTTIIIIFLGSLAFYLQWRFTHTSRIGWESTVTEASGHGKWLPYKTAKSWMSVAQESCLEQNIPVVHHLEQR